jgi:hypothetical protein
VRVLLRNIETGLFYEDASKWTADQTAAFDFEKTHRVVALVFATKLEGVEMLLTSEDPQFDLILPVNRENPPAPPIQLSEVIKPEAVGSDQPEPQNRTSSTSASSI